MRCSACNETFSSYEILWNKNTNNFEDLCRKCRIIVRNTLQDFDSTWINQKIPQDVLNYYEDSIDEPLEEVYNDEYSDD